MWVIVAKKGLDIHRDDLISTLLDEEKTNESFKNGGKAVSFYQKMHMNSICLNAGLVYSF